MKKPTYKQILWYTISYVIVNRLIVVFKNFNRKKGVIENDRY